MQLRLSKRNESNDPIEKGIFPIPIYRDNSGAYQERPDEINVEANNFNDSVFQVCFCTNSSAKKFNDQTYPQFEKFGFAKPRMWDQYGDKYKGVCLILSKQEILKSLDRVRYKYREIDYTTYQKFEKKMNNYNTKLVKIKDHERCFNTYTDFIKEVVFLKHVDYQNESEFRICSFSNEDQGIDISGSLKGIVMSNLGWNNNVADHFHSKAQNAFNLSFINSSLWFRDFKKVVAYNR